MIHSGVFRNVAPLLISVLALMALVAEPAAARRADGERSSLVLAPTAHYQTRSFPAPAPAGACAPFVTRGACMLMVSVALRGRGVEPMRTGSRFLTGPHVRTGYASISACLSGETMSGRGNCNTSVPYCLSASACTPSWNARVSTEYQYDGTTARRIWLDPSSLGGLGFIVRTSHAFSLPRVSRYGPLAIGEDITVTGSIPATRQVRIALRLRMIVSPTGGVTYFARGM